MFSGIVECVGIVHEIRAENSNLHFILLAPFAEELKIDQSVAHNGVCLTVVEIYAGSYRVTAIEETLTRTNLGKWKVGDKVNLERSLRLGDRIDGHMVQGHVDLVAICTAKHDLDGSWKFFFEYEDGSQHFAVQKGSICVNGVSLTVVDAARIGFTVCVIPFTYNHTNFCDIDVGDYVNLEFDVLGKYVMQYMILNNFPSI